jgi:hypothetical protein
MCPMDSHTGAPIHRRSSIATRGPQRNPQDHLRSFKGILQAEGYGGFGEIYRGGEVVEATCMADARRKFWDVYEKTKSTLSREALERMAAFTMDLAMRRAA